MSANIPSVVLSIIIPVYDRRAKLERAVRSVLEAIDDRAELIVVDDASPTPVAGFLPQSPGKTVSIRRLTENSGPAAARNEGIEAAKGTWVTFLDSDDAWLPGRFEQIMAGIAAAGEDEPGADEPGGQEPGGDYAPVVWGAAVLRVNRKGMPVYHRVTRSGLQAPLNTSGCRMCPCSTMVTRKSVFERIGGFDPNLRRLEDYDWFLRFFSLGGVMHQSKEALVFVDRSVGGDPAHVRAAGQRILAKLVRKPRMIRAYIGLELARSAWFSGRYWAFVGHLLVSRNLHRRFRLQIQPVKTRKAKEAELNLLSGLQRLRD